MNATVLDLRKNMRSILSALDRNEKVNLTYRGRKKATIIPVSEEERQNKVETHEAFGIWKDDEQKSDVDKYIRELRRGRSF